MKERLEFDPILLEILKNSTIWTCKEMAKLLERVAYSPLFSEAYDFATAILDSKGELVGQFSWQAAQLGAMSLMAGWTIEEIGIENIEPGDLLFQNDAYRGGTHVPEITLTRPIFFENKLVGFSSALGHLADIGGIVPGGFPPTADSIFQEGIRFPPVKIWRRGEPAEDIIKIFLNNVRIPRDIEGDLNAFIGSVLLAEKRVVELVSKYGLETIERFFEAVKDYSERRMRQEIAKIPDGNYVGEDIMDDDGVQRQNLKIKVVVVKKGDQLIVDYTDTDPQAVGPINCPWSVTASATYNAVVHLMDPSIPINSGCFRPIKVIAPPGTLVNVDHPGPINGGHTEFSNHTAFAVVKAFLPVLPERVVAAGPDCAHNFTGGGIDPRTNEYYSFWWGCSGGTGARATKDGQSAITLIIGNCRNFPVETWENRYPWFVEELYLRNDSGGPGKFRGGLGTVRKMRLEAPEGIINYFADRAENPPWGVFGGKPGGPSELLWFKEGKNRPVTKEELGTFSATKFMNAKVKKGDYFFLKSCGGGGYGDPLERNPEEVLNDVREEYVSIEKAEEEYGVVIDRRRMNIDMDRTQKKRKQLKAQR